MANDEPVKRFKAIERTARRKLEMLAVAKGLSLPQKPTGQPARSPQGRRQGVQYSIRINDQWRICFRWSGGAEDVEIVDYH